MSNEPTDNERLPASDGLTATRRDILESAMLVPAAALVGGLAAGPAQAAGQATTPKQPAAGQSLYDRLGGIFAIAAVVNHFSDAIIRDPIAGARSRNPQLREWHTRQLDRLPGLKFMRTQWIAAMAGGPIQYTGLPLEQAHAEFHLTQEEFEEVGAEIVRALEFFKVPEKETQELVAAYNTSMTEVVSA